MINDVRERSRGASSFLPWRGLSEAWAQEGPGAGPVGGKEREGRSVCWGASLPRALAPDEVLLQVGDTTVL